MPADIKQKSMKPVAAYAKAAEGAPREEFMLRPEFDACPLKVWGIRCLGRLGSLAAQAVLLRIIESYEAQFKDLLHVTQGRELDAYKAFTIGHMNECFYEAYKALKACGRDLLGERRVAGADALRRIR